MFYRMFYFTCDRSLNTAKILSLRLSITLVCAVSKRFKRIGKRFPPAPPTPISRSTVIMVVSLSHKRHFCQFC